MKTRVQALSTGALCAGFLLFSPLSGLEWAPAPDRAVPSASAAQKDIIYLYVSPRMGAPGEKWLHTLENPSSDINVLLDPHFIICKIELPSKIGRDIPDSVNMAVRGLKHGINILPAMVLADSANRPYARLLGGILHERDALSKARAVNETRHLREARDALLEQARSASHQEKEKLLLQAMRFIPPETWTEHYPAIVEELKELGCTHPLYVNAIQASQRILAETSILECIHDMPELPSIDRIDQDIERLEKLAYRENLTGERRQFILLTYIYPLYVHKTFLLYDGATNAELEQAFNKSVELLEQVRDMDRNSNWGKKAHNLREELRKARLAAAKYD